MNWQTKGNSCYLFENILIASFAFIFVILSFDCFFQNLPLSGYGIIFLTLIIASCTSISLCHAFKQCFKLVGAETSTEESRLFCKIRKEEKKMIDGFFNKEIASLQYPTNLNEQMRLLLKDIERDYVKHWYSDVSNNPSFLFDCHLVLEEILFKILAKLKQANVKLLVKNILFLYLSHIQEYKRALRRAKKCNLLNSVEEKENAVDQMYRCQHPGSVDDPSLNHYLTRIIEILARECAPHELVSSIECTILNHILARKMLKTFLVNIENPTWIYIRILYATNHDMYVELMQGNSYSLKEITEPEPDEKLKARVKQSLLTRNADYGSNIFKRSLNSKAFMGGSNEKSILNLPLLHTIKPETNISSVLGNLISSTAAPLLPDNASLCYQPLNKMWLSPVTELKQEFAESVVNPLLKTINEFSDKKGNGLKERFLLTRSKVLTRSKSSDAMTPPDEEEGINPPLTQRDISVGEEMNEGIFMGEETARRLVKTQSFDAGSGDLQDADGTASPVYEEPEDFATTIAKLRNVLQQRESSSTLSDKSVQSIESQDAKDAFDSKKPSLEEVNSIDSQMACDIPSDGRPFVNISIPSTEIREHSNNSYVLYTIQYDGIYIKHSDEDETQLVLQTTIVKRRFQEFLNLQTRLEENPGLRPHLKGIKGPAKWINLPFGVKTDDVTTASRRPILEKFLQQLCDRIEIASSPALQEFLAYGSNAVGTFNGSDNHSSIQKIDKFISNKVTGVFNSIKTALPSFDVNPLDAREIKEKPFQEQNLLQGFLNFGNKPEDVSPIILNYQISEATGEALTDHVRHYLAEKSDCIEDALDVLDNSDWHSEAGECHVLNSNSGCVWLKFKEAVIDDELDKFTPDAPVFNLIVDVLCELLDSSEGWITKEPVLRLLKVMSSRWEKQFQGQIEILDWDRISGNLLRMLRAVVFNQQATGAADLNPAKVQEELRKSIVSLLPNSLVQLIGVDNVTSAVNLFLESLHYPRCNRDVILSVFDLLVSQLLSCQHLSKEKICASI